MASDDGCNENDINLKHFKIHFICGIFDGGCFYYMSSYYLQLLSKKWSLNIESTFLPWVSLKGLLLAYRYIFSTFVVRRIGLWWKFDPAFTHSLLHIPYISTNILTKWVHLHPHLAPSGKYHLHWKVFAMWAFRG